MRMHLADANSVVKGTREILNPERSSFVQMSVKEHGGSNIRRKVFIPKRQLTLLSALTARGAFQHMGISLENTAAMIAMSWTVFWKNGNLNHVVPKSKIRAGIKDIVLEASR